MGIHDGHRSRMKEQFIENGLVGFSDVNVLEMLLFFAIPRKDTNELAHELINKFGSLYNVFLASFRELLEVPGMTRTAAVLITFVPRLTQRIEISNTKSDTIIKSVDDAAKFLIPRFKNEHEEIFYVICLDARRNVICCSEMARGTARSVNVDIRKLVEEVLRNRAISVIIAHNHPNGRPINSAEDDHVTKQVYSSLKTLQIPLEDHLIIVDERYFSYAKSGRFELLLR